MKNCLDDEAAGDDAGEGGAEVGDDGQQAAAQGVAEDYARFAGALGPGGADVVLVEHLEHAAAGEARDVGGVNETEGKRGQDAVLGEIPAGGVHPAQLQGEEEDEERAHDKGGHADADHGEGGGGVVDAGVFLHRGDDAEGNADGEGDEDGPEAEFEGGGKFVGEDLVDGAVGVFERGAEVDAEGGVDVVVGAAVLGGVGEEAPGGEFLRGDVPEVGAVLVEEGLIEAVVRLEVALDFRGDGFLGGEGAAGHESQHEKRRRDDDEQDGDRLQEAAKDEAEHGKLVELVSW